MYRKISILMTLLAFVVVACNDRPKTKEEFFKAGTEQLRAQKPQTAVIYFKNALEKDQNYIEARFELGKAYSLLGKYDAAEKEFQKLLLQRPGSREVQIELARAFAMGGKPEEALKAMVRLGSAGSDVDLLEISGWAHAQKGDYETARSELKKAVALQPARTKTRSLLARVYLFMGEPAAARQQVNELLKKDPSDRESLYLLADTQIREKDGAGAIKTYDQIIKNFPEHASGFFRKGLLLLDLNRPGEARNLSEMLVKKFSNQPEGYELKGLVLLKQKEYKEAVSLLQKTLTFKATARIHYLVALCHFYNEELEQAMNQLQRALSVDPRFGQARIVAALIYLKKNKIDDCITEVRKILAAEERNAIAHSILGSAYLRKGLYSEGIAELNRALELNPALVDAHIKKGVFELSRGRPLEAETDLSAAVRADPDLLNTRLLLASFYLKLQHPAKAIATAREGLRNRNTDAALYNIMADAYLQERNTKDAMSALEKAKAADARYPATHFKMAALYRLSGQREKGFALLKTFAENSPENTQAQLAVASMLETGGSGKEARTFYERAWKTGTTEGAIECARYYIRNGNADKASALLEESHRKNPSDKLCLAKGQAYLAQKKFGEALQAFEYLARSQPESGLAAVVKTYFAMNKPEKALERVRREMKGKPGRSDLRAELCRIYARMGRHKDAAENASRIIQQEPASPLGYITLAMIHESAHEPDKAIEVLRSASRVNDEKLAVMLGNLYSGRKDYTLALSEYQKAETIQAGYVPAIFQKASTLNLIGKKKKAIAEYRRVLKISPDHVPALNNLAYLFAEDSNTAPAALPYAVRAYMLAPGDGAVQDTLGFVLLKNGRIDEGLKALKQAASVVTGNPSIYYHLALALKENKQTAEAVAYLKKAIEIGNFPEFEQAEKLLQKLVRGASDRGR